MQDRSQSTTKQLVTQEGEEDPDKGWILPYSDGTHEIAKRVVVAALLAALSIAVTPTATYVPRLNWGIALFDPTSIFWIIAFLIGGIWVGLVSMSAGVLLLNFFDPFAPVGPFVKLLATLPMIVIPWLGTKFVQWRSEGDPSYHNSQEETEVGSGGRILSRPGFFATMMVLALLIRLIITIPVNLSIVPTLYGITDVEFIIIYTIVLNISTAFFDAFIPYLVVYPTSVYDNFKLW
ncbi:hypothetical protein EU537_01715 [Candidatus Thorarchaeota archaeon]|nr:MAG: hypothetical protein EU537_01715 [Candidatus Thorarchaeota archaeon]